MWECQVGEQDGDQDDEKTVEHGIFPSTKEVSMENAITYDHGSSEDDAEHGMFPSVMAASEDVFYDALSEDYDDVPPQMAYIFGGVMDEEVEHGIFPSTKAANGVEYGDECTYIPPTHIYDELHHIPCESERHTPHLSESGK